MKKYKLFDALILFGLVGVILWAIYRVLLSVGAWRWDIVFER